MRTGHQPFFSVCRVALGCVMSFPNAPGCSFAHQGQLSVVTRYGPIGRGVRGTGSVAPTAARANRHWLTTVPK